jgi:hypothetical protein
MSDLDILDGPNFLLQHCPTLQIKRKEEGEAKRKHLRQKKIRPLFSLGIGMLVLLFFENVLGYS